MKKVIVKRIVGLVFTFTIFAFMSQNIFAKSDLQITAGYHLDTYKRPEGSNYNYSEVINGIHFGATNYNLFDVLPTNGILSVGFMDEVSCSYNFNYIRSKYASDLAFLFFIGPAIGVNIIDILKLQVSVGAYFGVSAIYPDMNSGIGGDAQIKFLPQKKISPVIGYKYKFNIFNANIVGKQNSHDVYVAFCINLKEKSKQKTN